MREPSLTIATHNGAFHADDVFAVAVLKLLHPRARLIRTRDPLLIDPADFAVDVGGIWDAAKGRFDHHQKGFTGARANGVVYASAGLVWKAHGLALVQALCPHLAADAASQVHTSIDLDLVQHLDMADTGAAQGAPGYFGLAAIVSAFNTTHSEERALRLGCSAAQDPAALYAVRSDTLKMNRFLEAVGQVQAILRRLVAQFDDELAAADVVRGAERVLGGRVLVLPEPGLSWSRVVCQEMPAVRFVVYPDSTDGQYQVRTVPVEPESFKSRLNLPEAWAGLRGEALAAVTGVPDAVFCHNGLFIGGAVSRDGALRLAELALAA